MSGSWGHQLRRLVSAVACPPQYEQVRQVPDWRDKSRLVWQPHCAGRACPERPAFVTSYLYVTGRAGRVTDRKQYVCQAHAERFAKLHGLEVPA